MVMYVGENVVICVTAGLL